MGISFSEIMTPLPTENIMIVDALNLAFRYKHSKIRHFKLHYTSTIKSLAKSYKCGKIIVVCDKGSSEFRKAICDRYKLDRKEKYEQQSDEDKEASALFFEDFEECMEETSKEFPLLRFQGVEADDLAAYLVITLQYEKVWLISSDKDWDLLIDPKVSRFSYVTRKEVTVNNWKEHYEVPINKYLSYKCLTGDAGDSVDGVAGIGPKRAASIIEDYGDIYSIISLLPLDGKYKYIKNLNESANLLNRNIKLMDLKKHCAEAIGAENIAKITEILK